MTPSGRTALVTGASTGIGREIAIALAREGYDVAITARDAHGPLAGVALDPAFSRRRVVPVALDLREEGSIAAALGAAVAGLGSIDVLVNNAARPASRQFRTFGNRSAGLASNGCRVIRNR